MRQYVIIDIEQKYVQAYGDVLVVKANEVKAADELEQLEKVSRKKYFKFSKNECEETAVFMLPFSEELAEELVRLAKKYEEGVFWTPNMEDFEDGSLNTPKGPIKIQKSMKLVRRRRRIDNIKYIYKDAQTYIPPVSDRDFKHRVVNGINIVTFPATQTDVWETLNGELCWGIGKKAFFVFPDDEENMKMLNEAIKLDPHKRQFWIPNISEFYHNRVVMKGIFGSTEHDLYISNKLSKDIIIDNLRDALW